MHKYVETGMENGFFSSSRAPVCRLRIRSQLPQVFGCQTIKRKKTCKQHEQSRSTSNSSTARIIRSGIFRSIMTGKLPPSRYFQSLFFFVPLMSFVTW